MKNNRSLAKQLAIALVIWIGFSFTVDAFMFYLPNLTKPLIIVHVISILVVVFVLNYIALNSERRSRHEEK